MTYTLGNPSAPGTIPLGQRGELAGFPQRFQGFTGFRERVEAALLQRAEDAHRDRPRARAVRPLAVGRNNWLFLGGGDGGLSTASVLMSLAVKPTDVNHLLPDAWAQRQIPAAS